MTEAFIYSTDALDALLTCLSEHDLAALEATKETLTSKTDTLNALLPCLSEYDLVALQAIYTSRLVKTKQEMDQLLIPETRNEPIQVWADIRDALVAEQTRRHYATGSYEW